MPKTVIHAALSENRLIRLLIKLCDELGLDRREFVIFGSGPLLAHGLRQSVSDLDIVACGKAWLAVSQHGVPATGSISGAPMVLFWGELIQFSQGWIPSKDKDWGIRDTVDLIDRAEIFQGLPFAQLTDVLAYKQNLNRPKDRPDIRVLLDLLSQPGRAHGLTSSHAAPQPASS